MFQRFPRSASVVFHGDDETPYNRVFAWMDGGFSKEKEVAAWIDDGMFHPGCAAYFKAEGFTPEEAGKPAQCPGHKASVGRCFTMGWMDDVQCFAAMNSARETTQTTAYVPDTAQKPEETSGLRV